MGLSEKQIEDVFETFYKELIYPDLVFKGRQVPLGKNQLRVDLHFEDKDKKNVIVELKKDAVTREDVGQLVQYAGTVKNSRVILIAPIIPQSIKTAFEHYGIEYIEFSITKVKELHRLYKQVKDTLDVEKTKPSIPIHKEDFVKMPTQLRDGNIAFKVTYNDRNWSGICSPDVFEYNKENRVWCGIQARKRSNCQKNYKDKDLGEDCYPCYDSIALKTMSFSPGWNHGQNKPYKCLQAKIGKLAILTSLKQGEDQTGRFIFAIFEIEKMKTLNKEDEYDFAGSEYYYGNKKTVIKLSKRQYLNFWDYYHNPNAPDKKAWGTGLFRYPTDSEVRRLLNAILKSSKFTKQQKQNAKVLLKKVS